MEAHSRSNDARLEVLSGVGDDLPHLLERCLRHLSSWELLVCMRVCRKWREWISSTPALWRKISLEGKPFEERGLEPFDGARELSRGRQRASELSRSRQTALGLRLNGIRRLLRYGRYAVTDLDLSRFPDIQWSHMASDLNACPDLARVWLGCSVCAGDIEDINRDARPGLRVHAVLAPSNLSEDSAGLLSRIADAAESVALHANGVRMRIRRSSTLPRAPLSRFVESLAEILATSRSLTVIDLSGARIGSCGAAALAGALRVQPQTSVDETLRTCDTPLRLLDLSDTELCGVERDSHAVDSPAYDDRGALNLADVLSANSTLTSLNVLDNALQADARAAFVGCLRRGAALRTVCGLNARGLVEGANPAGGRTLEDADVHLLVAELSRVASPVSSLTLDGSALGALPQIGRLFEALEGEGGHTAVLSMRQCKLCPTAANWVSSDILRWTRALDLTGNPLGASGTEQLATALRQHHDGALQQLSLAGVQMAGGDDGYDPCGIRALIDAVQHLPQLSSLNILCNDLKAADVAAAEAALHASGTLLTLCGLWPHMGEAHFPVSAPHSKERPLDFSEASAAEQGQCMGPGDAKLLAADLRKAASTQGLRSLSFRGEFLCGRPVSVFLAPRTPVRPHQGPLFDASGIKRLSEALIHDPDLTALHFEGVPLCGVGCLGEGRYSPVPTVALAMMLLKNTVLRSLGLDACALVGRCGASVLGTGEDREEEEHTAGLEALGMALASNTTLTCLSLARNRIGAVGAAALTSGGVAVRSLRVLDLSGNCIRADALTTLAAALTSDAQHSVMMGSLTTLNLFDNPLCNRVPSHITSERHRTTSERYDPGGVQALASAIEGGSALTNLNLLKCGLQQAESAQMLMLLCRDDTGLQSLCGIAPDACSVSLPRLGLQPNDVKLLARDLASQSELKSLDLSGNEMCAVSRAFDLEVARSGRALEGRHVGTSDYDMRQPLWKISGEYDSSALPVLAIMIVDHPGLETVNLSESLMSAVDGYGDGEAGLRNGPEATALWGFAESLAQSRLRSVTLPSGVTLPLGALKRGHVTVLDDLPQRCLRPEDGFILAAAVAVSHDALRVVDVLDGPGIGISAARRLISAAKGRRTPLRLCGDLLDREAADFARVPLGNLGALLIAHDLVLVGSLSRLTLSYTRIGEEGAIAVIQALLGRQEPNAIHIDLTGNNMESYGLPEYFEYPQIRRVSSNPMCI
ncbi:hypothetical protein CYMTET_22302 [Cymbomonas tetramitiformis]|uniref:F-box domain-containing protein n=1 Tax=Cymbomonas tetramitiformis TaxID=36881 RepID=A0AAE0L296_9CHLO|nr:hypothetical protein CYMTET_22302 [Cymbomonas tetramitiformis]